MVQNRHRFRTPDLDYEDNNFDVSIIHNRTESLRNEYSDDYDKMASASRSADQRALSLFDSAINDTPLDVTSYKRRRQRVLASSERQTFRPRQVKHSERSQSEQRNTEPHQRVQVQKLPAGLTSYSPSDSVTSQMRRIERRLDNLLDYKLPTADHFDDFKTRLSSINKRMKDHKDMLDKYSGVEMGEIVPVSDRINAKSMMIQSRR